MSTDPFVYDGENSVLLDWERGDWSRLPPPPSVHSQAYREFVLAQMLRIAEGRRRSVASLGCGNASIEVELAASGFEVLATDNSRCALSIAAGKGLKTAHFDVRGPAAIGTFDIVYLDGVAGHLLAHTGGCELLARALLFLSKEDGLLAMSNDLSDGEEVTLSVTGYPGGCFYRGPQGNIAQQLAPWLGPWKPLDSHIFQFERPGRGAREREFTVFSQEFTVTGERTESK